MGRVGIICLNTPGHLISMVALAGATPARGHQVAFFLLGNPSASVAVVGLRPFRCAELCSHLTSTEPSFSNSAHSRADRRSNTLFRSVHTPLMQSSRSARLSFVQRAAG